MKPRNVVVVLILGWLLATTAMHCQTITHAPTPEQCRADVAVWKTQIKADIVALPVRTLLERANYLSDCSNVLLDAQDRDGYKWVDTVRWVYQQHALGRALKFIDRNNLGHQFYDEDAKGAR